VVQAPKVGLNGNAPDDGVLPQPRAVDPWPAVDRLIDRAPDWDALCAHRLHLLAARRWREQAREVPEWLVEAEHAASLATVLVELVLERARAAYDGRIVLFKGYEVAQRYLAPSLRPFVDIDLLVDDARRAQKALIAAGFEEVGDPVLYEDIHHLRPVAMPGLPIPIELHHEPKWPDRIATKPQISELFERAIPSSTGIEGVETLSPADHAVVLIGHAWAHEPLQTVLELLDVQLTTGTNEDETRRTARAWGLGRITDATLRTAAHVFAGEPLPMGLRLSARHLAHGTERTVADSHLTAWLAPLWEGHGFERLRWVGNAFMDDFRPRSGEGWSSKRRRMFAALRRARTARRVHDAMLGDDAHVGAIVTPARQPPP